MIPTSPRRRPSLTTCALVVAASLGATQEASAEESAVDQISRYCTTSWRNAGIDAADWDDCTQETFAELLERISRDGFAEAIDQPKSHSRRELNRAIWRVAKRRQRGRQHVSLDEGWRESGRLDDPHAEVESRETREAVAAAREVLSERQREIVADWMAGATVAEIAGRLETTPARVSDEKYKALRKLRPALGGCC